MLHQIRRAPGIFLVTAQYQHQNRGRCTDTDKNYLRMIQLIRKARLMRHNTRKWTFRVQIQHRDCILLIFIYSAGEYIYYPWGNKDVASPNWEPINGMASKLSYPGKCKLWEHRITSGEQQWCWYSDGIRITRKQQQYWSAGDEVLSWIECFQSF